MNPNSFDINKFLQKKSSRHHYIPRFLIDGFTNDSGFLFVYDKVKNKIIDNVQSPKSVFFEMDRNTIEVTKDIQSSIIEEELYSKIDNQASKIVKNFQKQQLDKIEFTLEETSHFLFFIVCLFWRIPYTDYAVKHLLERTEINSQDIDIEYLRNDPTFRKLYRTNLIKHTVEEMKMHGKKGSVNINIHEYSQDFYVIGDNPIIFKKTPSGFSELGDIEYLIAISSRRIFSSTEKMVNKFASFNSILYNAAVIHQTNRFVGCSNYDALDKSIKFYLELKNKGLQFEINKMIFDNI